MMLINCSFCWADESDTVGYTILTDEEWSDAQTAIVAYFANHKDLFVSFGTNEELEFNSADDVFSQMTPRLISSSDANVFKHYLGDDYGTCTIANILHQIQWQTTS